MHLSIHLCVHMHVYPTCLCFIVLQELLVHCEQQVLRFVMRYLATTEVDTQDASAICSEVGAAVQCTLVCMPACMLAGALVQHIACLTR